MTVARDSSLTAPPRPLAAADPTEPEKAALVRMTGVSPRQINTWFSNARMRIWRRAVEKL